MLSEVSNIGCAWAHPAHPPPPALQVPKDRSDSSKSSTYIWSWGYLENISKRWGKIIKLHFLNMHFSYVCTLESHHFLLSNNLLALAWVEHSNKAYRYYYTINFGPFHRKSQRSIVFWNTSISSRKFQNIIYCYFRVPIWHIRGHHL